MEEKLRQAADLLAKAAVDHAQATSPSLLPREAVAEALRNSDSRLAQVQAQLDALTQNCNEQQVQLQQQLQSQAVQQGAEQQQLLQRLRMQASQQMAQHSTEHQQMQNQMAELVTELKDGFVKLQTAANDAQSERHAAQLQLLREISAELQQLRQLQAAANADAERHRRWQRLAWAADHTHLGEFTYLNELHVHCSSKPLVQKMLLEFMNGSSATVGKCLVEDPFLEYHTYSAFTSKLAEQVHSLTGRHVLMEDMRDGYWAKLD